MEAIIGNQDGGISYLEYHKLRSVDILVSANISKVVIGAHQQGHCHCIAMIIKSSVISSKEKIIDSFSTLSEST